MVRTLKYLLSVTLGVLLLAPIAVLMIQWISDGSWDFLNGKILSLIGHSIAYSSVIALVATLIGTACGFLLTQFRIRFKSFYAFALLLPILISPYIFAVAWKDLFVGIWGANTMNYGVVELIFVHSLLFFPLAMVISAGTLSRISASVEESSRMVTSYRRTVYKIIFPLIRPSIALSFVLIFIFSLSEFSVPAYLGVNTFTTDIFTQFSAFYNTKLALSQSMLLLFFSLALMLSEARMLSDSPFFSVDVKGNRTCTHEANRGKIWIYGFLNSFVFLAVLLPLSVLMYQSVFAQETFFIRAFNLIAPALINSVILALFGACAIVLIGLWSAWLKERDGYSLPHAVLLVMFIVPSIVFGIAAIHFYNTPLGNFIYGSVLILIIGYIARFGFIASRIIANGYKQLPPSLEEAALIMGVSPLKRFRKITLPLLAPSLFSAFVLSFVLCIGELGLTIMLYPAGMELAGVKIYTIAANAPQELTDAMILINLGTALFFIGLFVFAGKILFKRGAHE